jgi:methionine aminopeptidase
MKKNNNIQLANVRESGKYLTELLSLVYKEVKTGVRLLDLEDIAEKYMQKHKLK